MDFQVGVGSNSRLPTELLKIEQLHIIYFHHLGLDSGQFLFINCCYCLNILICRIVENVRCKFGIYWELIQFQGHCHYKQKKQIFVVISRL